MHKTGSARIGNESCPLVSQSHGRRDRLKNCHGGACEGQRIHTHSDRRIWGVLRESKVKIVNPQRETERMQVYAQKVAGRSYETTFTRGKNQGWTAEKDENLDRSSPSRLDDPQFSDTSSPDVQLVSHLTQATFWRKSARKELKKSGQELVWLQHHRELLSRLLRKVHHQIWRHLYKKVGLTWPWILYRPDTSRVECI